MNQPKFTPGPWEWFYDGGGTYSIGQEPDAQANPPHVTVWDRNHDRATANCNLIAAAPEMYEALEVLTRWAAYQINAELTDCIAGPIGAAREALAKAEGKP